MTQHVTREPDSWIKDCCPGHLDYSRWNALHHGGRPQWGRDLDRLTHKWGDLSAQLEKQQSQIS